MSGFPQHPVERYGEFFDGLLGNDGYLHDHQTLWNRICKINNVPIDSVLIQQIPRTLHPLRGIPWVTLVLGSGCGDDYPDNLPDQVSSQVVTKLEKWSEPNLPGNLSGKTFAADYAQALVRGRLGANPTSAGSDSSSSPVVAVTQLAAEVSLLAGLASGLSHHIRMFTADQSELKNASSATAFTEAWDGYATPMLKLRSEERRVGKECRSRWSPYP